MTWNSEFHFVGKCKAVCGLLGMLCESSNQDVGGWCLKGFERSVSGRRIYIYIYLFIFIYLFI